MERAGAIFPQIYKGEASNGEKGYWSKEERLYSHEKNSSGQKVKHSKAMSSSIWKSRKKRREKEFNKKKEN